MGRPRMTDVAERQNETAEVVSAGFIESFARRYPRRILETLLCDRTTGRNIIWADGEYEELGDGYGGDDEITIDSITGKMSGVVKPRVAKELERQSSRTKSRAEVFTPSWLVNKMNNHLDEDWFGRSDVFNIEGAVVQSMLEGFEEPEPQPIQGSLFDGLEGFEDLAPVEEKPQDTVPLCIIYDWESNEPFEFAALKGGM